ncbi:translation initiation factor IF-3 [Gammaproteobacteria bacterium]|nr:translation initiation factor IF-3 [Gammaproteobacteria bacterium]MDB3880787.1 translation initiation factor IF-3 [Gammaproteobacteria bacterium]MDB4816271.1 translation initiation factor IF-3 [Gammaproteobacteria bacterium]MDC0576749.1 translation initiation factor IF-3 [Gammaproteobacteria bacterium]MDC0590432.1 translation initiation factor IF-3 [Gammaproteobacteria bacterium]
MAQRKSFKKSEKRLPINGEIKADKIRLISESGEQLGIHSLSEAITKAEEASLDLVQMAKDGDPLVCRLLNHGKHIFDAKKQKAASKKKQKRQQIKEIKFRPVTEKNDYEIKVNKIKSFIENGDKAKITLRFRGREMAHQKIGMQLLKRVETDLESMANVEQFPTLEGRQLVMMMAPNKKN